ncbi:MAG: murein biosynthesis integral membrane protein MurJ [Planctomycetota bacterium]
MAERFESHARTVSLLTLVSRVTGLARDATFSRVFGAGPLMDAFFFAFMVPNLFRRLFGEGALAAAFLPAYAKLVDENPERARALASRTIHRLTVTLGAVVLAGELLLMMLSTLGDRPPVAIWLMMIMLPYMPLVCLVALLGAMLQVHRRFGPTAAAPIVLNVCLITAALFGARLSVNLDIVDDERIAHVALVALAVVIAGIIQLSWSMLALRRHPWWQRDTDAARDDLRSVIRQAGPMILGLGVLQINTLFDGIIASYPTTVGPMLGSLEYPLQEGAMAGVSFAQRLYQFPLGVFGIAIATAIFPLLARQADQPEDFATTVRRGLRLVVFIGLPASAGLMLVREPLVAAFLQGGEFTREDSTAVGWILLGYAPAVWAYSMNHVLTRAFYAKGDVRTPVRIAVRIVLLNLILNCALIWTPLREAGLAWSTSICATLQAIWLLRVQGRTSANLIDRDVRRSWMRTLGLTLMMTAIVGAATIAWPTITTWRDAVIALPVLTVIGVLAFGLGAMTLMKQELRWFLGRA